LRRYGGGAALLLDMDADKGLAVYECADKLNKRERVKHEWDALLPFMHRGDIKVVQFDEYYDERTGANVDWRPADVIMAELDARMGRS